MANPYHGPGTETAVAWARPVWLPLAAEAPHALWTPRRATRQLGLFKKQTGGIGRFGLLTLVVAPLPAGGGALFENGVSADSLAPEYLPAVAGGIWRAARAAVLPGTPGEQVTVVGFRATVIDAVTHPVDSNALSFELAAVQALRAAFAAAGLQPWSGAPLPEPDAAADPPLADRVTAARAQFMRLARTIEETAVVQALHPAGFRREAPGLYARPAADLQHVAQFAARWHAELQVRLGVVAPAAAALLTGETVLADYVDRFEGGITWSALAAPAGGGGAPWSLDLDADGMAVGTAVAAALREADEAFWRPWSSTAAVLAGGADGRLTLGARRTAALLHVTGQTAAALRVLDAQIAADEARGQAYFLRQLRALRRALEPT